MQLYETNETTAIYDIIQDCQKKHAKTDIFNDIKVFSMTNLRYKVIFVGNIPMSSLTHKIISLLSTTSPYFIDSVLC